MPQSAPLPPGSMGLPLLGELLPFAANPMQFIADRFTRHGAVFKTSLFGHPTACFVGGEAFAVFLDEKYFTRDSASPPSLQKLLSPGAVPFLAGPAHKTRKSLLMQAVGRTALPDYAPMIQQVCASRIDRWLKTPEVSLTTEVAEMGFALTEALFAGGNPAQPDLALRKAFDTFNTAFFAPPIELPFTAYTKGLKAREFMMDRFRAAVARQKAQPGTNIMAALLRAVDNGQRLSDEEVAMETLHFFFAAYAGVCGFLANFCLALTRNPDVQRRVREETGKLGPGPWTIDALNALPYLNQVCLEVKRFYPVIPLTFFARAITDVPVNGYVIPSGWRAFGCTFSTTHDARTWKDPEKFDPDRFSAERAEDKKMPTAFVPQGGGPIDGHRCAGEVLSTVMMKVFAAELLQRCQWTAPPQDFEFNMASVPPGPKGGLKVAMKAA